MPSSMPITTLGNSGLKITKICLGTMTFGNQADLLTSFSIMDKAFDAGIRFIDTADVYPLGGDLPLHGATEEIIGQWIHGRRSEVVLASKCFGPMGDGINDKGLSRLHIMQAVEASLKRLGTDYLDLYQAHQFDQDTPLDETLRAFDDLVHQGKVRYIGVSNWRPWQLAQGLTATKLSGLNPIVSVQPRYNLFFRMIEDDLISLCQTNGMGVISYNPLAGGLLTGRYGDIETITPNTRFGLSAGAGDLYQDRYWTQTHFELVNEYRRFCQGRGLPLTGTAIAWVLRQPGISAAIIGASHPDQLDGSLEALSIELTDTDLEFLDSLWWRLPRRYEGR